MTIRNSFKPSWSRIWEPPAVGLASASSRRGWTMRATGVDCVSVCRMNPRG